MTTDSMSAPSGESTSSSSPSSSPSASAPTTIDAALDQSFAAAMTADAAPASPETTDGDAPTTVEPSQDPITPETAPTKEGPIPFAVHKTALDNARTKVAEETRSQMMQQLQQELAPYAPALNALLQDEQTGSIEGLTSWMSRTASDPIRGPQLRSLLGRMLSLARGQGQAPAPAVDTEPEPDFEANGTPFYSAPQLQKWQQWHARQLEAKVSQQLQPVQQHVQQQQQHAQALQARAEADHWVTQTVQEMQQDPDFTAHRADVAARMKEAYMHLPTQLALQKSWHDVYRAIVMPKKVQEQQQQWLAQAAAKSRGSAQEPVAGAPAAHPRARTVDEALDRAFTGVR